jgi:hypothetical protein
LASSTFAAPADIDRRVALWSNNKTMSTRSQLDEHHAELAKVAEETVKAVHDNVNELHEKIATEAHAAAMTALERLEMDTSLGFWPALLLLLASGVGVGLTIYFFLMLSDLTDDLVNPYTLVERVNSKLKVELAAHALAVLAVVVAMHPWLTLLTLPALALRALWHRQKKLVIDATTCYNTKIQSQLRTRWGLMCGWHVVGTLFGFIQVLLHGIMALHRAAPHAMGDLHELHAKANGIHGIGHAHMLAGLNHF